MIVAKKLLKIIKRTNNMMIMESGLPVIEAKKEAPFAGDLLNRSRCAFVLRNIVETFRDECVVSLNGKWGTGKTTFLSMWEKQMEALDYKVIHFNSWENEDAEDPLIALIAEFKKISETDHIKWSTVTSNLGKVVLAMLPSIAGKLAKHFTGIDIQDIAEKGAEEVVDIINARIDEYSKQKAVVNDFQKALSEYVEESCNGKPLVFVIDELDRCNPSFAVKTLERIKHIFEVKGIVFVVAIDEIQLCHSIRGFYGSEQFDAKDYLRRFFKIQYDLPKADSTDLIHAIMDRFDYGKMPKVNDNYKSCYDDLPHLFSLLYEERDMSIRQMEQYVLFTRLALANCAGMNIDPITIAFLVYIKMFAPDFFNKYALSQISDDEVIKHFEENYNDKLFELQGSSPTYLFYTAVADMLAIRCGYQNLQRLYEKAQEPKLKIEVTKFDADRLLCCLKGKGPQMAEIDTLLPKINLVYSFPN